MERWAGRVAVVTGASSGIGEALAKELTKHGMKVAALARRVDKLQQLQKECSSSALKIYKCDVTNDNEITSVVNSIFEDLGPISVLINNAGVAEPMTLTDTKNGSCRKHYETNVIALVTFTQHVIEMMKMNNITDGHIINMNSIYGHFISSTPFLANYGASKNAVTAITESLRIELAEMKSDIRVTSISPGIVRTDMTVRAIEDGSTKLPYLTTGDVVEAVIYVLSTKPYVNISELKLQVVGEDAHAIGR